MRGRGSAENRNGIRDRCRESGKRPGVAPQNNEWSSTNTDVRWLADQVSTASLHFFMMQGLSHGCKPLRSKPFRAASCDILGQSSAPIYTRGRYIRVEKRPLISGITRHYIVPTEQFARCQASVQTYQVYWVGRRIPVEPLWYVHSDAWFEHLSLHPGLVELRKEFGVARNLLMNVLES